MSGATDDDASIQRVRCWCDQACQIAQRDACDNGSASSAQRCGVAEITLTELRGEPHTVSLSAVPDGAHLLLVLALQGDCAVAQDQTEAHLDSGGLCLVHNAARVEFRFNSPFRQLHLRFPAAQLSRVCPSWMHHLGRNIAAGQGASPILVATSMALLDQGPELAPHSVKAVWNAVLGLICATLNVVGPHDLLGASLTKMPHKERIKHFIQSELQNPHLSVGLISQRLGLSARHIHRLYADETGSVMRGIWDARLDECYREISLEEHSRRPMHDIALTWGFNDQAHFSRLFRQRFGVSPREVRNASRPAR